MMTEIVHTAGWYAPYQVGGTEVYVEGLIDELARRGMRSAVLLPRAAEAPARYVHADATVETYPVNEIPTQAELRYGTPHDGFEHFRRCLQRHKGAIYHQHSWTRGCGLPHLLAAKEMGFSTIVTVHVPSHFCLRGTMRRFGGMGCDGVVDAGTCGACWAQERGLPLSLARIAAALPTPVSRFARVSGTRLGTALGARDLASDKKAQLQRMIAAADRIVAVCQWVYDAFVANGVPRDKLLLNRQGIARDFARSAAEAVEPGLVTESADRLELLYVGSFNPVKGIDVAVRAVLSLSEELPVRLTIRAPTGGPEQQAYEARVREFVGDDARIVFGGPVSRENLAEVMRSHDVLMVPSTCMETGPLVVLEAQAIGLFVLGSNLGGIAELLRDPNEGVLLPPGDIAAWAGMIGQLAAKKNAGALDRIPRSVRDMSTVGAEMASLYAMLDRSGHTIAEPSRRRN